MKHVFGTPKSDLVFVKIALQKCSHKVTSVLLKEYYKQQIMRPCWPLSLKKLILKLEFRGIAEVQFEA